MSQQIADLRARAHRLRDLAKYANGRDFKAEMAEADRLDSEARRYEELEKQAVKDGVDHAR